MKRALYYLGLFFCISFTAIPIATKPAKKAPLSDEQRFEYCVKIVLAHEGGYVNDADDEGETKFGISKHQYPDLNIKDLTLKQAKEIYKKDYWDTQPYSKIKDLTLTAKIFDLSVNFGAPRANKLLQRALRSIGITTPEDGVISPIILEAINRANPKELLAALKSEAAGMYRALSITKPKKAKFLKGWLRRAYN